MDPGNLEPPGLAQRPSWMEFCDKHARSVSEDFFAGFLQYLKAHPTSEFRPREPIDFAKKFVELFLKYFERKISNDASLDSDGAWGSGCNPNQGPSVFVEGGSGMNGFTGPGAIHDEDSSQHENDHFQESSSTLQTNYQDDDRVNSFSSANTSNTPSTLKSKGSILKRFSFRKIKQRNLFKQNSDEMELASGSSENYSREKHLHDQKQSKRSKRLHKESKHKLAPITSHASGEIKKEGIVLMFIGEDSKGKSRWEKTRLVLFKSESDYLLEFYSPPKVIIK